MADEMSLANTPLTLIVAATTTNGIGKANGLPWPMLKKEMAYFARITKRVPPRAGEGRRNVVIMGRKTWDSIPPKFRPLKDRTNVVISTQARDSLAGVTSEVVVAKDIRSSLSALEALIQKGAVPPVGKTFVIGGSSIYQKALELQQTKEILLTRIHKDYDCDIFFPAELDDETTSGSGWSRASRDQLQAVVGEEIPEGLMLEAAGDEKVEFEYQLYIRS